MTRARAVALGLAAILLVGCAASKVPNDAQVTVTGALHLPSGAPAAGVTVGLIERPTGVAALAELTLTVASIGMLCLTKTVAICKDGRKTTTGPDGIYAFTMTGQQSKNLLGSPAHFVLSAQLPSGAQVQTQFDLTTVTIAVPTTTFWEPRQLSAVPAADYVTYAFSELSIRPSGYQVSLTRSDETIWTQAGAASGKIDARTLADADADFHVVATADRPGVGVNFTTDYHTPRIPLHGKAPAPVSRGMQCAVAGDSGPVPVRPCSLTDGEYRGSFPRQSCPAATPSASPTRCAAGTFVQLDLGVTRPLSAAFLYGLGMPAEAVIETSDDGLKWTKRARQKQTEYLAIALPAGTSGRYVRVKSANDTQTIFSLTEFAVY